MANGQTRVALSEIQRKNQSGNTEESELKSLNEKGAKQPKFPLKSGASEHNHSN